MSTLIAAVAYYRMSTDHQEASIPAQRTEVQAYAAKHGYQIIREYQDEAISGDDTAKRLDFQRILRDATEKGDFQAVLCWDQDRFGRFDPLEAGYWIKPLRDAGIYLETVAQGRINWDDFSGRIIYAVQQEGKHAFLQDLSRNITRGMLRKAKEGTWLGGLPPYGYIVKGGHLVVGEPEKADAVRWLFRTYAETATSLRMLAYELTCRGVPCPRGKKWDQTTIRGILVNPIYCGDMVWNRLHEGRYHGVENAEIIAKRRRGNRTKNRQADWVVVPGTHEALVDRELWETVQQKLVERRKYSALKRGGGDFLLTGLVFCGHCGSVMHGSRFTFVKDGPVHRKFACSRYTKLGKRGCHCNRIEESPLVRVLLRKVESFFLDQENLKQLKQEVQQQLTARVKESFDQGKRLRSELAKLDRQIEQGNERYLTAPANLMAGLAAKLEEWNKRRDELQAELRALEVPDGAATDLAAKVENALRQLTALKDRIYEIDPARGRELLRQMVSRVECWFDRVPFGTRERGVLSKGVIHLRPGLTVIGPVESG